MTLEAKSRSCSKKLVIVGDGFCGKTCLLMVFASGEFPENYVPTIFETYATPIQVSEAQMVNLHLWDTAGQEEYDRLRSLSYIDCDVILICYSVNNRDSYENVRVTWVPEINHFCAGKPVLLVATKSDLRNSDETDETLVQISEGDNLARELRLNGFVECSAKTNVGVQDVFLQACNLTLTPKRKNFRCPIL